jgi:hypothetical protein
MSAVVTMKEPHPVPAHAVHHVLRLNVTVKIYISSSSSNVFVIQTQYVFCKAGTKYLNVN